MAFSGNYMFEGLNTKLNKVFKNLKSRGKLLVLKKSVEAFCRGPSSCTRIMRKLQVLSQSSYCTFRQNV